MPKSIEPLRPWVSKPYREERVLAAARTLQQPVMLREVAKAAGLPLHVTHRCLCRLTKKGVLTRCKAKISYPTFIHGKWIAGGRQRLVYLYSFAEPSE